MQKAIENYIDIQSRLGELLDNIKVDIDKVAEAAIKKARRKQRAEWRKLNN